MLAEGDPVMYLESGARISEDGRYRYTLTRVWSRALSGRLVVVGLNPSTADADQDDPTIRRCVGFAQREVMGGLVMVNLFAFRATDPAHLGGTPDPVGPLNDEALQGAFWEYGLTGILLAAWGANAFAAPRADAVMELLQGGRFRCLGYTKDGYPRHPLYVRAHVSMVGYPMVAA